MATLSEVVGSYKSWLEIKRPEVVQKYCDRLTASPEGARAEAVVFSHFRSRGFDVSVEEVLGTGGVDFLCEKEEAKFFIEVTAIGAEAAALKSTLPDIDPSKLDAQSFGQITEIIRTRVSGKADQMSNREVPTILVMACEHSLSELILGPRAASECLTGGSQIGVTVGTDPVESKNVTHLQESVFFRWSADKTTIEPCRRSISCLLLVQVYEHELRIVGVLHPDPRVLFPVKLLPDVPFAKAANWPLVSNVLEVEWQIGEVCAQVYIHNRVEIADEELRRLE